MKIIAHTKDAHALIKRIKSKIENENIKTWDIIDTNIGDVYNHTPDQWSNKALIKPEDHDKGLLFKIVWWGKAGEPEVDIKGYIIGRFTEMLMVHCSDLFVYLEIRA